MGEGYSWQEHTCKDCVLLKKFYGVARMEMSQLEIKRGSTIIHNQDLQFPFSKLEGLLA